MEKLTPSGSIYAAAEKLAQASTPIITPQRFLNKKAQFMQEVEMERKKSPTIPTAPYGYN